MTKEDDDHKPASADQQNAAPQHDETTKASDPPSQNPTKLNALVHGLHASDIVLPWESKEDFEQLWNDLKKEWMPKDRQENETVLSLAHMNWLKHRLMRTTQVAFRRDPFFSELQKQGIKTWAGMSEFLAKKAEDESTLRTEVLTTAKAWGKAATEVSKLLTSSNPQMAAIQKDIKNIVKAFAEDRVRIYRKLYRDKPNASDKTDAKFNDLAEIDPTALMDQAYRPDYLAKLVQIEASIDARIDKILRRLIDIKEYKAIMQRLHGSTPAIAPPNSKN